ncbi:MAG: YigZ family protein [Chloroflexi bacterium]|nr:YigZ family protein [Chloroflexota bacterium]MDL1882801.1 YigZ family protein [Anaerolineae bacterium CFX8]
MSSCYLIPAEENRITTTVSNSRFIATAACVTSSDEARQFIQRIRSDMPDASHHVYAFRVGYGNSIIEGMSDDGEPSGTAGPPVLTVLRGSDIGDVIIVVTRYFGGTKLGTGGLVRAYSDAARAVLASLKTQEKRARCVIGVEFSYAACETIKRLIAKYEGDIEDETFAGEVTLIIRLPVEHFPAFAQDINELTAGRSQAIILS